MITATLTTIHNGYEYGYKKPVRVSATATAPEDGETGNTAYFSLTGLVLKTWRAKDDFIAGGQIDALSNFTIFDIVALVHLCDHKGTPLHAEQNARYWAGLTKWQTADTNQLAQHLQTTKQQAAAIATDLQNGHTWATILETYRLPQLWQTHADNARHAIRNAQRPETAAN